jgi:preprotein translocase subunit YajC
VIFTVNITIIYHPQLKDKLKGGQSMLMTGGIIAALGIISAALGVLTLWGGPVPGLSDKFTWPFWMTLSTILLLLSIVFLLMRRQNSGD